MNGHSRAAAAHPNGKRKSTLEPGLGRADEVADVSVAASARPSSVTSSRLSDDVRDVSLTRRSERCCTRTDAELRCPSSCGFCVPPQLLDSVQELVVPWIRAADDELSFSSATGSSSQENGTQPSNGADSVPVLLDHQSPQELRDLLALNLRDDAGGKDALLGMVQTVLKYSVNTWSQGFLDKLYASTNAVRERLRRLKPYEPS